MTEAFSEPSGSTSSRAWLWGCIIMAILLPLTTILGVVGLVRYTEALPPLPSGHPRAAPLLSGNGVLTRKELSECAGIAWAHAQGKAAAGALPCPVGQQLAESPFGVFQVESAALKALEQLDPKATIGATRLLEPDGTDYKSSRERMDTSRKSDRWRLEADAGSALVSFYFAWNNELDILSLNKVVVRPSSPRALAEEEEGERDQRRQSDHHPH